MSSTASNAEAGARPAPGGRIARFLPATAFLLYACTLPGLLRGAQAGVYLTAAALVERGSFAIDGSLDALTGDRPGTYAQVAYVAGHYYVALPPGLALLAVPCYLLGLLVAPLLGPTATIGAVALLGPLLAALVALRFARPAARQGAGGVVALAVAALVGLPLHRAAPTVFAVLAIVALVASWALPLAARVLRGAGRDSDAATLGLLAGCPLLFDYGLGVLGGLLLLGFLVALLRRRRDLRAGALALVGAGVPLALLLLWQTALFGAPWYPAFRVALDPAGRGPWSPLRLFAALRPTRAAPLVPLDWFAPVTLAALLLVAALLAAVAQLGRAPGLGRVRRGLATSGLVFALLVPALLGRGAAAATADDYAPRFATDAGQPVWVVERGTRTADLLRLEAGGSAVSPWIEARPGLHYGFSGGGTGPLRLTFLWEDAARVGVGSQVAEFGDGAARVAGFAAPVGAAGLRLRLDALGSPATLDAPRLHLADGVRVEPFPDGHRAALAFSFDWESAMGGLIHSRSAGGEGEGATVGLRADGGPSVAEAEAKGLRMREGARYLADLFARHGIRATFYSTGYNLLDGNPACQKFAGDPIYRNANQANGWGSDWWRTHPWYGDDPCATEAQAPAWYFASETRALAAAGHEIASHTFGHLYVRGVSPAQLREDLDLWNRAAEALGLPPARTFAFPWTSSNSLTADFWAVFAQAGMTILTRVYPSDVRYPYELAPVRGEPNLIVFPDFYLASNAKALDEALARIDVTLASRGYHSLWNHPNEAIEQNGQLIWQRAVEHAAAQRERGLWIAPVTAIAEYGRATRLVAVTALPVAGGEYLIVENRSGQRLTGVTLGLSAAGRVAIDGRSSGDAPTATVGLPTLEPGARVVVLVAR